MNFKQIFLYLLIAVVLSSCATSQKIVYFQDTQVNEEQSVVKGKYITIQPQDQLSIIISSKNTELAAVFNIPRAAAYVGGRTEASNSNGQILGYTVTQDGDLTIYGQRDKVLLIRTHGNRTTYKLDLRSNEIFNSPAFYIQQNDVIYIEPNGVRSNQSTVNGNTARSVSLWMSIASFLTTIGVLIFK